VVRNISSISITLLSTLWVSIQCVGFAAAQRAGRSSGLAPEWRDRESQIEAVLLKSAHGCPDEMTSKPAPIETADVTGDGIPEALVDYCHMGAYTSDVVLMRLEHGSPVLARFRDIKGKNVSPAFLRGASVRNGENSVLDIGNHAVYALHWHTNNSGALENCTVDAYVWNPRLGTFDQANRVAKEIVRRECPRTRKALECLERPCSQ
jgi:hypothetical protein